VKNIKDHDSRTIGSERKKARILREWIVLVALPR
jgi:hypothetical protein